MKISFTEKKDNLARIELQLTKDDYQDAVEKKLKELAKRANVPGFRKGHVPVGMIKKMYGDGAKIETIESLISEKLYNFIKEEKLETLGQPMPAADQAEIDFAKAEDITITFEQALIPPITDYLSKDDKLPYYKIETTDEMVEQMLEGSRMDAGQNVEVDSVEDNDIVRGTICELDGDLPKEGGIRLEENAMLLPRFMKNDEEKAKFIGSSKNSVVIFSPYKAYDGQATEIASLLRIEKDQVEALKDQEFSFEISKITRHEKAELNQEFFDRVFGEGVVKSEEEAKAKIREFSDARTAPDSTFQFLTDLKKYVRENKIKNIELSEEAIKRWFITTENGKKLSEEELTTEFPKLIESLKIDLYLNAHSKKYEITVSEDEVKNYALEVTRMQLQQYGMNSIPDESLQGLAQRLLSEENSRRQIYTQIEEQKMANSLKEDVTLEEQTVSSEEFAKISQPQEPTQEAEEPAKED